MRKGNRKAGWETDSRRDETMDAYEITMRRPERRRRTRGTFLSGVLAGVVVLGLLTGMPLLSAGQGRREQTNPFWRILFPQQTVPETVPATVPETVPVTVPATLPKETAPSQEGRYFRSLLNEESQKAYDVYLDCIATHESRSPEVFLSDLDQVTTILEYLAWDYPEYFWFKPYTYYHTKKDGGYYVSLEPKYRYTAQESDTYGKFIDRQIQPVLDELADQSEYDKVVGVYRFLVDYFYYDLDYKNNSLYEAFRDRRTVCANYARAMQYMLTRLGVESIYVKGSTVNGDPDGHAWNVVKVNGKYYQVDSTWGDPVTKDGSQVLEYDYCLIDDATMMRDHIYDTSMYPPCTSMEDHYFVREGRYYDTYDRKVFTELFRTPAATGEKVTFRMSNRTAYEKTLDTLFEKDEIWEIMSDLGWRGTVKSYTYYKDEVTYVISVVFKRN